MTEMKQHVRSYTQCVTDELFLNRMPLLENLADLEQPVPLPGGQVSGMASHQRCRTCRVGGVWRPLDLPQGLPPRQPRGRAARHMWRFRRGLPPGWRVAGRCKVEGTPHNPQRARFPVVVSW